MFITNVSLERQLHKLANAQAPLIRTPRFLSSAVKQTISAKSIKNPVSSFNAGNVTNIPNARNPAALTALSLSRTAPNNIVMIKTAFCL